MEVIIDKVKTKFDLKITDFYALILNEITPNPKFIQNFIILLLKHFIYAKRCANEIPQYTTFVKKLHMYQDIEREIAVQKNKVGYHELKWNLLKAITV